MMNRVVTMDALREWCAGKESPYFTKRDLMDIYDLRDDEALEMIERWEMVLEHEKGSRWYKLYAINAPRYHVDFDRVRLPKFHDISSVTEPTDRCAAIKTYDMDIRKVFNDMMLKDILAEEEAK